MSKLLIWLGLEPNEEEKHILEMLNINGLSSMRVIGRGTLIMDAVEARSTKEAKDFIESLKKKQSLNK